MAYYNGTIHSGCLGMMIGVAAAIPNEPAHTEPDGSMPVVYLLHGLSDDHQSWALRSKIELYANEFGCAVIMPEVQRSFYTDMTYGLPYYTYITKELPAIAHTQFRVSENPGNTYIAGLSMGGYGALKAALREPERYAAAASFSGAVDVKRRLGLLGEKEQTALCDGVVSPENDLFRLAEQVKNCPPLYLAEGESDFMLEDNRLFDRHLTALGIAHTYEEWPGDHNWRFWDTAVEKAFHFFFDGR